MNYLNETAYFALAVFLAGLIFSFLGSYTDGTDTAKIGEVLGLTCTFQ